jgi:heme A synthase
MLQLNRFARYAWLVLFYNLLVILWGAYVRATGSGAGCGSHWPLCNGQVVPRVPQVETLIEFAHRATSGVSLLAVVILVVWAFRSYPRRSPVRAAAAWSGVFIITEALLGAGLVLFGLVADNDSLARAVSMSLHLVNTFLLIAVLTLTAWWASGGQTARVEASRGLVWALRAGLLLAILLGVSGAVTALGDTLFPASSLAEGIQQDFSLTASLLIRLRVLHPVLAVIIGVYLILVARAARSQSAQPTTEGLVRLLIGLVVVQLVAGAINVLLLAPVWMQLLHLLLADLVWLALVLLSASFSTVPVPQLQAVEAQA